MKKKNRLLQILTPDTRIYMIIITVLILLIGYYNRSIGVVGVFLLAYLLYYNLKISNMKKKEWAEYIERLSSDIDSATKQSILNMPIPLTMVDIDGTITWYNQKFSGIVQSTDLLERNIHDLVKNFDLRAMMRKDTPEFWHAAVDKRSFKVLFNVVKEEKRQGEDYRILLYWIEYTLYENLKRRYNQEKLVVALAQVDNYDEVMKSTDDTNRPRVSADIDHRMQVWASQLKGLARKYEQDKYILIFEHQYLESQETKRFEILDDVRDIHLGNSIPPTLSIGVGTMGKDYQECMAYANTAKDLCLGRGGDQVAVKKNDDIKFYGGKSKAVEKRTKVKARVIAYGLRQLMDQAEAVLVMGHKNSDLDALGAALGIYRAARNRKKTAHIVLKESNPSIEVLYQRMMKIPEYQKAVIDGQEAQKIQGSKKTLVVVVDTHRPIYTECPELLKEGSKIVLIDHHRRSTDFIENPILTYHETYASSTSEMVTEIIHYMEEKLHLESLEAEALMAGIALDTKNFTFKTGVRTFEAASYLRRAGADTTLVRQMFQDDLQSIVSRAEVVKKAEIILDKIAIAISEDVSERANLVAAQAADIMLNIRGAKASFVLGNDPNGQIFISGRSLGDVNVQVILEKLGGGGHMTVAGAQLKNIKIEEAKIKLIQAITEVLEEEEEEDEG
ncbi:c-di-AMP phosphodiesterase, consists of a GGDEF-like and DHH domains [Tindallia magadiensis]|uniref:Cyclic-di-AMP phosphodiesterase n=1 Tax=Tindallia magadiensis TaxID=69895 RepID=A0A1I3GG56_9FIRM|nr:DHH family phosphoesterase [Tindallia magadiensis]SFI22439.1 c-di-AMP phosphodiesterase, consists of a GGDEF-like and DHH domains [Tindallia magadiensis]